MQSKTKRRQDVIPMEKRQNEEISKKITRTTNRLLKSFSYIVTHDQIIFH